MEPLVEAARICAADGVGLPFAYIGPGAGLTIAGSFVAILLAVLSALSALATWPFRLLWRLVRRRGRRRGEARVGRVAVLGLDGLDPELTEKFLAEGLLPNLAALREKGSYHRLGTTYPPLSPVAWSSFATGSNPGKHNIFDFIGRNPTTYGPVVSSVRIRPPRLVLPIGPYRLPLSRPEIRMLRKSKPFWTVLGEAGVFSAILRVPITFPCDRFEGVQLAAMSVPDLLGTQGTHFRYVEAGCEPSGEASGGETADSYGVGKRLGLKRHGDRLTGKLHGPANPLRGDGREVQLRFTLTRGTDKQATLSVGGQQNELTVGEDSPWIRVTFRLAPTVKLRGICRFRLTQVTPHVELYCTPIQLDPASPAMPISHPPVYSHYLSRRQGLFATLGLAEDTSALSDGALSEDAFLQQAYQIHDERRRMFFDALDHVRRGLVVCVFDGPDRIQHMFWRFIDQGHPALADRPNTHASSIREMYQKMDQLVGETHERMGPDTALIVMSDHGFKPFRRGVDLNRWLLDNDYLCLKDGATTSTNAYLADVDWQQTRAFALGLSGLFINQQGREAQGIVPAGQQKDQLVAEIARRLTRLVDPEQGTVAIHEAVARERAYHGPYVEGAPDIIAGYNVGYRVSWESAVGKTSDSVFSDNVKPWSGDHCIHPELVPGVLFSSVRLEGRGANIVDLAPTIMELLGVAPPEYMDGKSLLCEDDDSCKA